MTTYCEPSRTVFSRVDIQRNDEIGMLFHASQENIRQPQGTGRSALPGHRSIE